MSEAPVTITLPPMMAKILRDVCEEWINDHARFSAATKTMCSMFLAVILEEIDKQIKPTMPSDAIVGCVCPVCHQAFKSPRGLKTHRSKMRHECPSPSSPS